MARSPNDGERAFFSEDKENLVLFNRILCNFALVKGQKMCYTVAKENLEVFVMKVKETLKSGSLNNP